jgi:hypothetical protein
MEKKTEVPGVYKVSEGVLINKDKAALAAYKLRKDKDRKVIMIEDELRCLRNDIEDIKNLLKGLVK